LKADPGEGTGAGEIQPSYQRCYSTFHLDEPSPCTIEGPAKAFRKIMLEELQFR